MGKLTTIAAAFIVGAGIFAGWPTDAPAAGRTFAEASAVNGADAASPMPEFTQAPATATEAAYGPAAALPATGLQPSPTQTLDAAVRQWKSELAKLQGFEAFQEASWTSSPLGPGVHGWVVILKKGADEVGYMVIHAAPDGSFRLSEYGTGSSPLFSLATLYRTLVQHGLIDMSYDQFADRPELHGERCYFNPMQAVWKLRINDSVYLIDAKTGELLPVKENTLPQQSAFAGEAVAKTQSSHNIIESLELPTFDPFERLPWVKGKPIDIRSFADVKERLDNRNKMTFVAFLYGYEVTVPLAVIGYHAWSSDNYLLLDQDGLRAVHYDHLPSSSRFYR